MLAFFTVASLHFLAAAAPGPDFAIVVKNAMIYSRRQGVITALGIAIGLIVHITYSLMGLAIIISQSIFAFQIIKYLGATYLIYLGIKIFFTKGDSSTGTLAKNFKQKPRYWLKSFQEGFLCNVLNPKATLFFLSLFTLVIDPNTPFWIKLGYSVWMFIVTLLWFSFLSVMITHPRLQEILKSFQDKINKLMGGLLVIFGTHLAIFTRS